MPDLPAEIISDVASAIGAAMITRQSPEAIALAALRAAEPAIRAGQRERSAFLLRSLFPADFLARHGLRPGAGAGRVLAAAADEIEGTGAARPVVRAPQPAGPLPDRPKVSRRGRQEDD